MESGTELTLVLVQVNQCVFTKDDFESNIIMNRLINLLYIKIHMNSHGDYFFVKLEYIFQDSYS